MSEYILESEEISKRFGSVEILHGVSFTIKASLKASLLHRLKWLP
jgi:ABC-type sugar transport system ATPase subunit